MEPWQLWWLDWQHKRRYHSYYPGHNNSKDYSWYWPTKLEKSTARRKGYPILEADEYYLEWHTKMVRRLKSDSMERLVNLSFVNSAATAGSNRKLLPLQIVFFSVVLDRVLLNKKGKHLNRVYKDDLQELWIKYKAHLTSLATAQGIAINLMTKLSEVTISSTTSKSDLLE